jgi:hypothetical protein
MFLSLYSQNNHCSLPNRLLIYTSEPVCKISSNYCTGTSVIIICKPIQNLTQNVYTENMNEAVIWFEFDLKFCYSQTGCRNCILLYSCRFFFILILVDNKSYIFIYFFTDWSTSVWFALKNCPSVVTTLDTFKIPRNALQVEDIDRL